MSGYFSRSIKDTLVKREYPLQSFLHGRRNCFDNKGEKEKETYQTEEKVENRFHVSTPFTGEMALDGRSNKYTISVVIQSIDSFHGNPVIQDIRMEDRNHKESVTYATGQGYCKYYLSTPFALETTLGRMDDKYAIFIDIHITDSNESPGFKNNKEDDRNKDTISLR